MNKWNNKYLYILAFAIACLFAFIPQNHIIQNFRNNSYKSYSSATINPSFYLQSSLHASRVIKFGSVTISNFTRTQITVPTFDFSYLARITDYRPLLGGGCGAIFLVILSVIAVICRVLWICIVWIATAIWAFLCWLAKVTWPAICWLVRIIWIGLCWAARAIWLGLCWLARSIWPAICWTARVIWVGLCWLARVIWVGLSWLARVLWVGIRVSAKALWTCACWLARTSWIAIRWIGVTMWRAVVGAWRLISSPVKSLGKLFNPTKVIAPQVARTANIARTGATAVASEANIVTRAGAAAVAGEANIVRTGASAVAGEAKIISSGVTTTATTIAKNEASVVPKGASAIANEAKMVRTATTKVATNEARTTSGTTAAVKETKAAQEGVATRNADLAGQKHPKTGVPFVKKTVVDANGIKTVGVFPKFKAVAEVKLPADKYMVRNSKQFEFCDEKLKLQVQSDPNLANKFTKNQLSQIYNNETPDGYVWHHNEKAGLMQLVEESTHAQTGHTGGQTIWGGGTDNR